MITKKVLDSKIFFINNLLMKKHLEYNGLARYIVYRKLPIKSN